MMERADRQLRHARGNTVLGLLDDRSVTDVYLNPPRRIGEDGELWVERFGEVPRIVGTVSSGQAWNIVTAVAGSLGKFINETTPFVEGELFGDGPRFDGIIPPHTLAPAFAIRVPASRVYTIAEYVAAGLMTQRQADRIEFAVQERENIVVSGSTGTGKTTILNAIAEAVTRLTPDDRMVVIEDTFELQIQQKNTLRIRVGAGLDHNMAIRRAMRQLPKRIWVGEVRGGEALAMLKLWNTGHKGGACSLHSDIARPEEALLRVEQMVAEASRTPQQPTIARTINLIVCLDREANGRRKVAQIASVQGWDRDKRRYVISPEV